MTSSKVFKSALCQVKQALNKAETLNNARIQIEEAANNNAKVIFLGECFNSLYTKKHLSASAETIDETKPGETLEFLKNISKKTGTYIVAGSIPEKGEDGKLFNTALAFDRKGAMIAKFRKLHLFDIDIPGKATYKESDTFGAGNKIVTFDTEYCKFGLGICYDVRFPELGILMAKQGAKVLVYPGNFTVHTGNIGHWDLLLKARALDNQAYVVGCSVARYTEDPQVYQSWGHSTLVDPLAKVVASCKEEPAIVYGDIDVNLIDDTRKSIPCQFQKRKDIYLVDLQK